MSRSGRGTQDLWIPHDSPTGNNSCRIGSKHIHAPRPRTGIRSRSKAGGRSAEGDSAAAPLHPTKRATGPCVDLRYRRTSGEGLDSWSEAFGGAKSDCRVCTCLQRAVPPGRRGRKTPRPVAELAQTHAAGFAPEKRRNQLGARANCRFRTTRARIRIELQEDMGPRSGTPPRTGNPEPEQGRCRQSGGVCIPRRYRSPKGLPGSSSDDRKLQIPRAA